MEQELCLRAPSSPAPVSAARPNGRGLPPLADQGQVGCWMNRPVPGFTGDVSAWGSFQACVCVVCLKPAPLYRVVREKTQGFFLPMEGKPSSSYCGFLPPGSPLRLRRTLLWSPKVGCAPQRQASLRQTVGCAAIQLSSDTVWVDLVSDLTGQGLRLPKRPLLTPATAAWAE